jgi:hypothetical protein
VRTRQEALKWLCEESISTKHNDVVKRRSENSGQWFLNGEEFQKWLQKPDARLLLCPGKRISPNCAKLTGSWRREDFSTVRSIKVVLTQIAVQRQ